MSHIRIGVYAVTNGTAKEAADKAQEGMLNVFRGQPGFQAYGLAEAQDGKVISVSLWDSGDQAQKANEVFSTDCAVSGLLADEAAGDRRGGRVAA
jgi:heme-degrading monooxygenase HmoA